MYRESWFIKKIEKGREDEGRRIGRKRERQNELSECDDKECR